MPKSFVRFNIKHFEIGWIESHYIEGHGSVVFLTTLKKYTPVTALYLQKFDFIHIT